MDMTMLEIITHPSPTLHTTTQTVPIPSPQASQVLIKVVVASSNPKDWTHPTLQNRALNSGDDLAGIVHAIGSEVKEFKIGDRVATFHPMGTPHGAYAEYAIAPAHTVFHIPNRVTFEEASTIPLVSATAALTLFRRLGYTAPWLPKTDGAVKSPLIIYGASSALGVFTVKLARLADIHPLIAIGGGSSDYLKTLLDAEKGDAFVDYRIGVEAMKASVQKALGSLKAQRAIDCISENKSWIPVSQMLNAEKGSKLSVTSGANRYEELEIPDGVEVVYTFVGTAHEGRYRAGMPKVPKASDVEGDIEFAGRLFQWIGEMLAEGKYQGHPYEVIPGGLRGVEQGLQKLKNKEARGVKFVYRVDQTAA